MARSMWKGSLAFGLVSIPVELYSATRDHRPKFRLLHAKDEEPVRYERVCQKEGKPVAWEDLVKGYEYAKHQFVVLTKDDFKTAALEKTKTIDIMDFVDPKEIDERYFETPYYLTPGTGADRSYALLREAIRQSGRVGIAKVILRDAQHLAAIEAIGDALVLTMMRFADELVDLSEFRFPKHSGSRAAELTMARHLIGSFEAAWDPRKYTDEYKENLMRLIEAKMKGKAPRFVAEDHGPKQAEVVDLMARLRASHKGRRAAPKPKHAGSTRRAGASKRPKGKRVA
jgi:DNA end-binding protein Ku